MEYLAHISDDKTRKQTVLEHSQNVAMLAKQYADVFEAGSWGYCCGETHDIGKYSDEFQERLKGGKLVDHATASAKELIARGGMYSLAAYITAGHHAGLPDKGTDADDAGRGTLCGREKKKIPNYQAYKDEIKITELERPKRMIGKNAFSMAFFLRMIYSCVVDADFLDTENFMQEGKTNRQPGIITEELWDKLTSYISSWLACKDEDTVNGHRTQILKSCIKMGAEKPGVYTLTVPTGGGKTVSSLAFALQHACVHKKRRIIYIIPYTSIIEQNAKVFREILGENIVLENHSNVKYEEGDELNPMQLAAENWDKPVVVTTNVQFFESLFSNKSSRCRKLHNIADSILIFDEAQMIPLSYLIPCTAAIEELVQNYGCTAVLCTATQPALQPFFSEQTKFTEICPDVQAQFTFFKRTQVKQLGVLSRSELKERMKTGKQVLCILNSREDSQSLYRELVDELKSEEVETDEIQIEEADEAKLDSVEVCFYLSTYMYPIHRRRRLEQIRERLKSGKRCIVIATSLVEAGVDLDFDTVYRELAGVDSIVQAAGRCNREGNKKMEECTTYVFEFDKTNHQPSELKLPRELAKTVAQQYCDLASMEAIESYFCQLHSLKKEELDKKKILPMLEQYAKKASYPFASIAAEFKLIENETKTIVIGKEPEAEKIIQRLRFGEHSRELMRDVGQYSVQIYKDAYEKLRAAGYLEAVEGFDNELAILKGKELYKEEYGLQMDVGFGDAIFG